MQAALLFIAIVLGWLQAAEQKQSESRGKGSLSPGAKQADDELASKVRRLVRQLDAPEIAARDRAYDELVKLGPGALAYLPKPTENAPAAVRDAIGRLRDEFDRQAADQAMQGSKVSLAGKGIPLKDALEQIAKQTGNKVQLNDEAAAGKTIDAELKDVPFWKALDTVAERAKLTVYSFAQDTAELRPMPPGQRPRTEGAFYTGPMRFQATKLQLTRDPRIEGPASLSVGLEIAWEPRLRPISLRQKLDALEAKDEGGAVIEVEGQGELPVLVHQGSSAVEVELPFKAPARSVKSVASLAGSVDVLVPGSSESFEFAELDKGRKEEQQKHNASVALEGVRKVNDIWEVRIRVKYVQAFNAFDSHLVAWVLNNEAHVLDAKGQKIENAGLETTHRSENAIGVAYLFEAPQGLAGCKFVYHTASTIYRLPVPYELKDLALP